MKTLKSLPVCEGGLGTLGCPPLLCTIPCAAMFGAGGIIETDGLFIRIPAREKNRQNKHHVCFSTIYKAKFTCQSSLPNTRIKKAAFRDNDPSSKYIYMKVSYILQIRPVTAYYIGNLVIFVIMPPSHYKQPPATNPSLRQ